MSDKNTLLALFAFILFYISYYSYINYKYPDYNKPKVKNNKIIKQNDKKIEEISTKEIINQNDLDNIIKFENDKIVYGFDKKSGFIKNAILKNYYTKKNKKSKNINLIDRYFGIETYIGFTRFRDEKLFSIEKSKNYLKFSKNLENWNISKKFETTKDPYIINVYLKYKNISNKSRELIGNLVIKDHIFHTEKKDSFLPSITNNRKSVVYRLDKSLDYKLAKDICDKKTVSEQNVIVDFIGFQDNYFLKSVIFKENNLFSFNVKKIENSKSKHGCSISLNLSNTFGFVKPGESFEYKFQMYFGPKISEILEKSSPNLKETINFGWTKIVSFPLLISLKWINNFFKNFGISIIIMTIIIKILFYPLTKKSAVAMNKLKLLQPEINKIKSKFKDDTKKQQQAIMKFMVNNNINPMKGCLPIIPQLPVFIAFYNVLSNAIELRHAHFFAWITDLSAPDPYYITPILLGFIIFLQQKLNPNPGMDKTQEKVMMFVPIIFSLFMLNMPSGMLIYSLTNTIISLAQQEWIKRRINS